MGCPTFLRFLTWIWCNEGWNKINWKKFYFPSIFLTIEISKSVFLMFFENTLNKQFWPIEITLKPKIKVKSYPITHILSPPCPKCQKKNHLFGWPICLNSENHPPKRHFWGTRGPSSLLLICLFGDALKL